MKNGKLYGKPYGKLRSTQEAADTQVYRQEQSEFNTNKGSKF